MALQIVEFFGLKPLDPAARANVKARHCPFVDGKCIKPKHGSCTVRQIEDVSIICCPNRLYANNLKALKDIADSVFGGNCTLIAGNQIAERVKTGAFTGQEIAVFGRAWGRELPLPTPKNKGKTKSSNYFMDWILAKVNADGSLAEFVAVEVQTIDTTGNYIEQSEAYFEGKTFTDKQGRTPGFSSSGMNWENVNKRILPQLIYKGHVLRREAKCSKGIFFVCPQQVLQRIKERLGDNMHDYDPGNGTITFWSYELGAPKPQGEYRELVFSGKFTTTVDQVALAFTSPINLPERNVYETAIRKVLQS